MPKVSEDLIEIFIVVFLKIFDIMSGIRSNDILDLFRGGIGAFIFDDMIEFFKYFPFVFLFRLIICLLLLFSISVRCAD
jgi:hypothetical protein